MSGSIINIVLVFSLTILLFKDILFGHFLNNCDYDDDENGFQVNCSVYCEFTGFGRFWKTTRQVLDFDTMPFQEDSSVLAKDLKVMNLFLFYFYNI